MKSSDYMRNYSFDLLVGFYTKYSEFRDLLKNNICEIERLYGEWLF